MRQIKNEKDLIKQLKTDIESTDLKNIVFIAGHFPLRIDTKTKIAFEDLNIWGDFPTYTLELASTLAKHALKYDKNVKFILICDDIFYQKDNKKAFADETYKSDRQLERELQNARRSFFKKHSGDDAKLNPIFDNILKKHGFNNSYLLKQNQGKESRQNCHYFSEIILKNSPNGQKKDLQNINTCSRAYIAMLESGQLKTKGINPYLVSFVPNKCSHYICDAVDFFVKDFKGSHIFMDTLNSPKKNEIYNQNVFYKKDSGFNNC